MIWSDIQANSICSEVYSMILNFCLFFNCLRPDKLTIANFSAAFFAWISETEL